MPQEWNRESRDPFFVTRPSSGPVSALLPPLILIAPDIFAGNQDRAFKWTAEAFFISTM